MGRKPKNSPQDLETMSAEMQTAKRNRSPESRLYSRTESLQAVDRQVSQIVRDARSEFRAVEPISLSDTSRIRAIAEQYLYACEHTSTFPRLTGLCRALGYSSEAVRKWRIGHPDHETTLLIENFKQLCADVLEEAGLRGASNAILTVFLLKANWNYRDTVSLETVQTDRPFLTPPEDPAEIAERYAYLLEDFQETN